MICIEGRGSRTIRVAAILHYKLWSPNSNEADVTSSEIRIMQKT